MTRTAGSDMTSADLPHGSCQHCGAPYDARLFAAHGQFCPHTLSGRWAAQRIVDELKGLSDGVAADVIAREIRSAHAVEREACAQIAAAHVCGCGDHATEAADKIRKRGAP